MGLKPLHVNLKGSIPPQTTLSRWHQAAGLGRQGVGGDGNQSYTHTHTHRHTYAQYTRAHSHTHTRAHTCTHARAHVLARTCTHACTHVHTYTHTYALSCGLCEASAVNPPEHPLHTRHCSRCFLSPNSPGSSERRAGDPQEASWLKVKKQSMAGT